MQFNSQTENFQKSSGLQSKINWSAFLERSDMVWAHLPTSWDDGIFLGNGNFGTIFWRTEDGQLRWEISRPDLYDHRRCTTNISVLYHRCRLPNGQFHLGWGEETLNGNLRLDLWNAEVHGSLLTSEGAWNIRAFIHAKLNILVLELISDAQTRLPVLEWFPEIAKSTRGGQQPSGSEAYPPQSRRNQGQTFVSVQEMPEDAKYGTQGAGVGQYANAWKSLLANGKVIYFISTEFTYPGTGAEERAVANIAEAERLGLNSLLSSHRTWWHEFYPKSFLSIPHGPLESFYWIQIYKMGSASRQNGPLLDFMGPWYEKGIWPAVWWNLNVQLTYWPFYMSNHLPEAEPLLEAMWNCREALARNAAPHSDDSYAIGRASALDCESPVGVEVGNLPWVMHNLWLHYRCTMDDAYLRERLFPLMKGTFNYLRHISLVDSDGKIAMLETASPEYTDKVDNSSYTLACYRWLAVALIEAGERLQLNDRLLDECRTVLQNLTPYEVSPESGIMVGKDLPFEDSHRHWSHLFMIYPFHEWDWLDDSRRAVINISLGNWTSKPTAFAGFSWLGAASINALAGKGDLALAYIEAFLQNGAQSNTLYRELAPVIETPLACARTLQELALTSHSGIIRIFPAIPSRWAEVCFADFRAEGAFLISACRKKGVTNWVRVESLAGEPCHIHTGLPGTILISGADPSIILERRSNGEISLKLAKGESVFIYSDSNPPDLRTAYVERTVTGSAWGGQRGIIKTLNDSSQ